MDQQDKDKFVLTKPDTLALSKSTEILDSCYSRLDSIFQLTSLPSEYSHAVALTRDIRNYLRPHDIEYFKTNKLVTEIPKIVIFQAVAIEDLLQISLTNAREPGRKENDLLITLLDTMDKIEIPGMPEYLAPKVDPGLELLRRDLTPGWQEGNAISFNMAKRKIDKATKGIRALIDTISIRQPHVTSILALQNTIMYELMDRMDLTLGRPGNNREVILMLNNPIAFDSTTGDLNTEGRQGLTHLTMKAAELLSYYTSKTDELEGYPSAKSDYVELLGLTKGYHFQLSSFERKYGVRDLRIQR